MEADSSATPARFMARLRGGGGTIAGGAIQWEEQAELDPGGGPLHPQSW
jgi:hypothetical protein